MPKRSVQKTSGNEIRGGEMVAPKRRDPKEHWALNSISRKSVVKEHILDCNNCVKSNDILKLFSILRKCTLDYDTKTHETLLIKKYKPKINRQVYGNGSSFSLKIF